MIKFKRLEKEWRQRPMRLILLLFIVFAAIIYVPFIIKGGLQYDDWAVANLSKACPGLTNSFKCFWPGYPDRPLASLYYSVNSNLFHAWAPGYIVADVLAWLGGVILMFLVLSKRFGLRFATPFLFVAAIPTLSTTTIFSPGMQAIGSFTFLIWAVSFFLLDKYLESNNKKYWWGCYGFMLLGLLFYESSLPLFGLSAIWPLVIGKAKLGRGYWWAYFRKFILPIIVVLAIIVFYQDVIVLHYYHYISKVRIQDVQSGLYDFGVRTLLNDTYLMTMGLANFGVKGAMRLHSAGVRTAAEILVLAALSVSAVFVASKPKTVKGRSNWQWLWIGIGLSFLGVAFIHFIAVSSPTLVGYNNRGLVASSILVALAAGYFWHKSLYKNRLTLIIAVFMFAAYLSSFMIQKNNYIQANAQRLHMQVQVVPQVNKINQTGMFVLADAPTYTAKNFDNETIYSDEVLDWGNSLAVLSDAKGIQGISLSPERINRGELQIKDGQLMFMHQANQLVPLNRIWYFEAKTGQLSKVESLEELSSLLESARTTPPYTYLRAVDSIWRDKIRSWLASY